MRMKKLMILAAVAAIAATACTRTFEVEPTPGTAIGFGTWANTLTKTSHAAGTGNTAFIDEEKFDVFGFKTIGENSYPVFVGDDVTYASGTQTWSYENLRFWDPAATSYTFFAILPSGKLKDETTVSAYVTAGTFETIDLEFSDPTARTNDILVADKTLREKVAGVFPTSEVALAFNHMASSVDLKVKKDAVLHNATVKVTALDLVNISNKRKFTITYNTDTTDPNFNKPIPAWANATTPGTMGTGGVYSVALPAAGVTVTGETTYNADYSRNEGSSTDDYTDSATLFSDYVMMPQDLVANTQKIRLSYTIQIGTEQPNTYSNVEIDIRDFFATDAKLNKDTSGNTLTDNITAWQYGKHYTYYITIGANAISFTASVNPWTEVTGYNYILK